MARRRDELFRSHPQTPLPPRTRARIRGRPLLRLRPGVARPRGGRAGRAVRREIATSGEQPYSFTRFARASFALHGRGTGPRPLLAGGYGGGVFLSFADATSGARRTAPAATCSTPSRARISASDGGRLVLDFNFAYNPSCSYDPRWVCPLAPPGNRLAVPIRGGERYRSTPRPSLRRSNASSPGANGAGSRRARRRSGRSRRSASLCDDVAATVP